MTTPARRVALWTAALGAGAFGVLAALLVPWSPVPGGPLELPSVDSVLTPEEVARAEAYARWARVWSWSGLLLSVAVACALGFTARGRRLFARLPGPWWLQVVVAVAMFSLTVRASTLPLAVAHQQLRLDRGLSVQSWSGYARDVAVGQLVGIAVASVGLLVVLACARRWRRAWPAVAGGLAGGLVVIGSFGYPVLVEPLFNDFESLPEGTLRAQIMQLAETEQVTVDDVLVADASRRTTTLNAYVSGFAGTRRVVVYDTLVDALPPDEALTVVAHELAHARHHDVVVGTALGAAGVVGGVGLLALLIHRLGRRGYPSVTEPGIVPVLLALLALAGPVTAPVENGISRLVETRADVVALESTRDPDAFIAMQQRLARRSLADPTPNPVAHWWFGSHPTLLERVALAERMRQR